MDGAAGTLVEVAGPHELAQVAASTILAHAARALAERGRFHLALAGGSTPRATYAELARRAEPGDLAGWELWYGDERCMPPGHPDSNHAMVAEAWLTRIPAPPPDHRLRGEAEPAAEARRYEAELRAALGPEGRLDLVLLGLGPDGHTASLFPGSAALEEREAWVTVGHAPVPPHPRLTLTLPVLVAARAVLFLVSGSEKGPALASARAPREAPEPVPARLVRPRSGELLWLADRAACGTA